MSPPVSRREFVAGFTVAAASSVFSGTSRAADLTKSPFRISVINDEISQDFERACSVASEFGMAWIELRGMWNKNVLDLDVQEISESERLLKRYHRRVTDRATTLLRSRWSGAPKSE